MCYITPQKSFAYSVWWPISAQIYTCSIFCYMSYIIMEACLSSLPIIPISLVYSFSGMNTSCMNEWGPFSCSVKYQISISACIGQYFSVYCSIFCAKVYPASRRRSNKRVGLKGQLAPHCVPWLKNYILAYKRLSTSLGSKTLNNASLGLGGTKI